MGCGKEQAAGWHFIWKPPVCPLHLESVHQSEIQISSGLITGWKQSLSESFINRPWVTAPRSALWVGCTDWLGLLFVLALEAAQLRQGWSSNWTIVSQNWPVVWRGWLEDPLVWMWCKQNPTLPSSEPSLLEGLGQKPFDIKTGDMDWILQHPMCHHIFCLCPEWLRRLFKMS